MSLLLQATRTSTTCWPSCRLTRRTPSRRAATRCREVQRNSRGLQVQMQPLHGHTSRQNEEAYKGMRADCIAKVPSNALNFYRTCSCMCASYLWSTSCWCKRMSSAEPFLLWVQYQRHGLGVPSESWLLHFTRSSAMVIWNSFAMPCIRLTYSRQWLVQYGLCNTVSFSQCMCTTERIILRLTTGCAAESEGRDYSYPPWLRIVVIISRIMSKLS